MKKFFSKFIRFWNEDKSLTVMLLLLLAFIFILVPIGSQRRGSEILIKSIYSIFLFTGILSVTRNKKYLAGISVVAIISLLVNWISDIIPIPPMLIAHDICAIIYLLFFAIAILIKTFKSGEITFHRIVGSIVVYLVTGMIFAFTFHAVYTFAGAVSFNNLREPGLKEFLYFSFTSLTTMGYGDITPVHPLARSFANFEALIGQLYPAILIARLVSMEFESSGKKKEQQ